MSSLCSDHGDTALIIRGDPDWHDQPAWRMTVALVLDGITSPHTHRSYEHALEEFLIWIQAEPGRRFTKATVQRYRRELETKGLAPSSVNVRLAAIRHLAIEAADNGMMPGELAAGIARAHGVKRSGVRLGYWLTAEQAESVLAMPDPETIKGIRDRAILALLVGAGLRRSELCALNIEHLQLRDGRWLINDLVGKRGHIRTVPLADWTHAVLCRWFEAAGIQSGPVFRRVTRHGYIGVKRLSPQAVFAIVRTYAGQASLPARPHDLRRTFAKLAHLGQAPLEQIQLSLGHASAVTTEIYLGVRQDLRDAPCDRLGLNLLESRSQTRSPDSTVWLLLSTQA